VTRPAHLANGLWSVTWSAGGAVIGAPSPYPVYVDVVVAHQHRLEYAGRRVDRGVDVGPVAVEDQLDRGREAGTSPTLCAPRKAGRRHLPSRETAASSGDCKRGQTASSSTATFLVRLGSTWTPGPMVVETVILRM